MRLIQYFLPGSGRRVGFVDGDGVYDLTEFNPEWDCICRLFFEARQENRTIEEHISSFAAGYKHAAFIYSDLLGHLPGDAGGWLLPPVDHPDPAHCLVTGTGLTHLGSTAQRDKMHKAETTQKTDSQRMFEMGLENGKPEPGIRGVQPEWFYKGTGTVLRGHNDFLDIPSFTDDGGEEPEIVGCYIIGEDRYPYRIGFAIANEWSDHIMERVNYLWLAPSKMRTCSVGPELITDQPFKDIRGVCRIFRGDELLYDSDELLTGEENMSHSLANLEDHQFKYPHFRIPGDVHIHFFGTMKLSFGSRGPLQDGDKIEINFYGMGEPLVNYVRRIPPSGVPVMVKKG